MPWAGFDLSELEIETEQQALKPRIVSIGIKQDNPFVEVKKLLNA